MWTLKHILPAFALLTAVSYNSLPMDAALNTRKATIAFTTDVHGNFFPVNYITLKQGSGSMARVATAVDSLRREAGADNFLLLDNGDILQGQPTVYYYNYIDTLSPHLASDIYKYLKYDACTIGNHDVETGHAVYDRVRKLNGMPMLGANVIDDSTGQPYLEPYAVFERGGIKIAVLGLLTPAIPAWLPEELWRGLSFEDMTASARKWVPVIMEKEKPDVLIGLFHSGHDESKTTGSYLENASVKVAREVPGFNAVLIGHDHQLYNHPVTNVAGQTVHVINPGNNARAIGVIDVAFDSNGTPKVEATIVDVTGCEPSADFLNHFSKQQSEVYDFVKREIGVASDSMSTPDAFFGPSAFMTLLHGLQLKISGADISFAAPLSFDAGIDKGPIKVSDMFTLYKYENMLYVLEMTGKEVKDYLEEAYDLWINTLTPENGHIIKFASSSPTESDNRLANPSYNFDSAAGIDYTVDVTKPKGSRISIIQLSDGRKFDSSNTYTVAINSYRANGGGNILSKGAGISHGEMTKRIVRATDKDLRYYLIKAVEEDPDIKAVVNNNWRFIPEDIAAPAIKRDREILFSPQSSKEQK